MSEDKKIIDDFISTLSHEIRTPLTSIKGFAQTMNDNYDNLTDEQKKKFLTIIQEQSQRLINLAQNQKTMHKMTTDKVRAEFQADILNSIEEFLTEEEKDIARRGRNLPITINKRSNPTTHRIATAFEVLIGYWYLNDKSRLDEIFSIIDKITSKAES